jgi:hypothetical protein
MKLYYTLLFTVLPCLIFAQANYHQGYVIKNNGDTLKGFISRYEWEQNPRSIDFKLSKDDRNVLSFGPAAIKEFQVDGAGTYVAYSGFISKFPDLPLGLDTNKKSDTVFLKQVTKGKYLTLFYHRDDIKTRFFIAETNTQPVELKYAQYYDTESQVVAKAFYKGQLIFYINKFMPDNQKLARKADDVKFEQSDLEKVVSEINGGNTPVKKGAYFRFFAGGGLNNNKGHYRDNSELIGQFTYEGPIRVVDELPQTVSTYSTTVSPKLNFGVDVFTNKEVQKLIFRAELSFTYNNPKFRYLAYSRSADTNVYYTESFNQYTTTITPQVIFNLYNKDNFKLYVDGGIGINFSAYGNTKLPPGTDLHSFWVNFPVQVGIVINKKVELSLSYASPMIVVNYYNYFSIDNQFMSLGLKYLFNTR